MRSEVRILGREPNLKRRYDMRSLVLILAVVFLSGCAGAAVQTGSSGNVILSMPFYVGHGKCRITATTKGSIQYGVSCN